MNINNFLKRNKHELRTLAADLDIVLTKKLQLNLFSKDGLERQNNYSKYCGKEDGLVLMKQINTD